jgi:hypothetical protein
MESNKPVDDIVGNKIKLWIDPELDYLEVTFSDSPGHMRPTKSGAMMKRVDEQGRVIGFSRFQKNRPLEAELDPEA